jgi:hexosaminidase
MQKSALSFVAVLTLAASAAPTYLVWPPAQSIQATGSPLPLAANFKIEASHSQPSARLNAAVDRYAERIRTATTHSNAAGNAVGLKALRVVIAHPANEKLGLETDYSYELTIESDGTAEARAASVYGAMYAMDTFWQLVDERSGALKHSVVRIKDSPQYQWRGLMIDSGRRFFPMDTVKNLLDTMAGNKMSVLHLHASDECRWGVESKLYPNLTASLGGIHAGFYTQEDIKDMVKYAGDRGIRVVPEFDVPGHARGMIPVEGPDGVQFCEDAADRSQLYGDPDGKTYKVVHALMKEMASLFSDEVFNVGCDETRVKGPCTKMSTFDLERKLLSAIQTEFGKTPEGWEEVMFDAGAATNETIVNSWARHAPEQITKTGRMAVVSNHSHW